MTTLFYGPMKSQKSSFMVESLKRETLGRKKAILIRPSHDTREFTTRDKVLPRSIPILKINTDWHPFMLAKQLEKIDAIGIDEVHFFPPEWVKKFLVLYANKNIYLTALLFGKTQVMFDTVKEILPFIDKMTQCTAICEIHGKHCSNDATITFLKEELEHSPSFIKKNIKGGNDEEDPALVGDAKYVVACKNCFLEQVFFLRPNNDTYLK